MADHPTTEELVAYVDGNSSQAEPMEAHLRVCRGCLGIVVTARYAESIRADEAPSSLSVQQRAEQRQMLQRLIDGSTPSPQPMSAQGGAAGQNDIGVKSQPARQWSAAIAASTEGSAVVGVEDWWAIRHTADGGLLYVGNPVRVKSKKWNVVIVELPDRHAEGTILYSSPDLAVVRLVHPAADGAIGVTNEQ
jgi:hypothetical protein